MYFFHELLTADDDGQTIAPRLEDMRFYLAARQRGLLTSILQATTYRMHDAALLVSMRN